MLVEGRTSWLGDTNTTLPAVLRALMPRVPIDRARIEAAASLRGDRGWARYPHALLQLAFAAEILQLADPARAYERLAPLVGEHLAPSPLFPDDALLCAVTDVYLGPVSEWLRPFAGGAPDPRWRAPMAADAARCETGKYPHSSRQRAFLAQFAG